MITSKTEKEMEGILEATKNILEQPNTTGDLPMADENGKEVSQDPKREKDEEMKKESTQLINCEADSCQGKKESATSKNCANQVEKAEVTEVNHDKTKTEGTEDTRNDPKPGESIEGGDEKEKQQNIGAIIHTSKAEEAH